MLNNFVVGTYILLSSVISATDFHLNKFSQFMTIQFNVLILPFLPLNSTYKKILAAVCKFHINVSEIIFQVLFSISNKRSLREL